MKTLREMVQLQRNERRSDRRLPKKNWKSMRREFPQAFLFPQGSTGLTRLSMAMLKEQKIKK
jgi:hypothetical protein